MHPSSSSSPLLLTHTTQELLKPRDVFVRVYVLTGIRLNPKDSNGKSDPYLVARLGDQEISTRDRYHDATLVRCRCHLCV